MTPCILLYCACLSVYTGTNPRWPVVCVRSWFSSVALPRGGKPFRQVPQSVCPHTVRSLASSLSGISPECGSWNPQDVSVLSLP